MDDAERARAALDQLEREMADRTRAERKAKAKVEPEPEELDLMDQWKKSMEKNFFHRFDKYVK